jgi:DNA (cytosine-5)-methyltransferase 1
VAGTLTANSMTQGMGGNSDIGGHIIPVDVVPPVSGTLGGGSGTRGYPNSPDVTTFIPDVSPTVVGGPPFSRTGNGRVECEAIIPDVAATVTAKWSKGVGGPAGDECQHLVPVEIGPCGGKAVEVSPTLDTRAKDGPVRNPVGAAGICPVDPYTIRLAHTSANGCGIDRGVTHTLDAIGPDAVVYPLLEIGKRASPSSDRAKAGAGIGDDGDPMYTLQAGAKHGVAIGSRNEQTAVAFSVKDSGADAGEVSPTLRAMGHAGSHANGGGQVAVAIMSG